MSITLYNLHVGFSIYKIRVIVLFLLKEQKMRTNYFSASSLEINPFPNRVNKIHPWSRNGLPVKITL